MKYHYKGSQPKFTLQKFNPRTWEWDSDWSARSVAKTNAMKEFVDSSKEEPLTEAQLQQDVKDVKETLAARGKTKRTPEEVKSGQREQALPDHKPNANKPFTYESSGENIRYYLNFPNGEKWGPSPWQVNVFGRDSIVDAWDGPRLDEERAKSYAVARWWHDGVEKLRQQRIYSGPEYDKTIRKLRDMAATVMAPAGRPPVIATRKEGDFTREYSVQPSVRSDEHTGYEVMYKDSNGDWGRDHYNYNGDSSSYDEAIEKWLDNEKADLAKYALKDPVASSVAEDLSATNKLKVSMATPMTTGPKELARTRENDELPQKATIVLPNKTVKALVPVLKRLVATKANIPILQNVAIVTKNGKK